MRGRGTVLLAGLLLAGLAGCQEATAPSQLEVGAGTLPPIDRTYRDQIAAWARGFYAHPASLRDVQISDPVLIRDDTGRLLWQVCILADAAGPDGRYMGPQYQAFGFAPNYVSAPLARNKSTLIREDCQRPLTWRPWPQLTALASGRPVRTGRR